VADAVMEGRSQIVHEIVKNEFEEMDETMMTERLTE
jgi:hypothetical protein